MHGRLMVQNVPCCRYGLSHVALYRFLHGGWCSRFVLGLSVAFIASGGASSVGGYECDGACGARLWFPCVDTTVDRCTFSIDVVVGSLAPQLATSLGIIGFPGTGSGTQSATALGRTC